MKCQLNQGKRHKLKSKVTLIKKKIEKCILNIFFPKLLILTEILLQLKLFYEKFILKYFCFLPRGI